jgi:ketosteroid isomerase-like protein
MRPSGPVEDRLAIRELCETFGSAVMRADPEAWGSCWDEEAVWTIREGVTVRGRAQVVTRWTEIMNSLRFCSFIGFPAHLVIDGDRAAGSYFRQETLYFRNGDARTIVGRYDDIYVKRHGVWLLSVRAGAAPDHEAVIKGDGQGR